MDKHSVWKECDEAWVWPEDESVPRYKGTQLPKEEVVRILNRFFSMQRHEECNDNHQIW